LAGICSSRRITSGDFFSINLMRVGIFLMAKAPASVTWRDSSTTSLVGLAQQVSTKPWASSASLRALLWCWPWCTVPLIFLHLHEPQAPSLQP